MTYRHLMDLIVGITPHLKIFYVKSTHPLFIKYQVVKPYFIFWHMNCETLI